MCLEFRQGKPQRTFLPEEPFAFIGDSKTRIFRITDAFDEADIFQLTQVGHDIVLLERDQDAETGIVVGG